MTTIENSTTWQVRAIPAGVLAELRTTDDAGNPPRPVSDAEGGSPLRCCLSLSRPGEPIALVSYAPLRRWAAETGADPGPYDETGPVFIHPGACPGPGGESFPAAYLGSRRVLRAYAADGSILGGRLAEPGELRDEAAAGGVLGEVFANPRVALVHARALEFGCFTFEVRRA
ncbi:MAG: DUF1203 domain-containing protein [Streptosporangiaceae bacterium]